MGVDVVDIGSRQTRTLQRHLHAAIGAVTVFRRSGDVEGISRQAVTDDFRIDLRAARLCVLELFENDDAGALAHDEAVTVDVIGARGFFRVVVVLGGQRLAGGKARERDTANRRFRTTGNHDVGVAERNQAAGVTDRMRAGRAGGDDRVVRAAKLMADRHLARGEVDEATGNEERRDTARTLVAQRVAAFDDAFETANARADQDAGGDLVLVVLRLPAGVGQRHVGSGHRVDDERIDLALFLRLHPVVGIEGCVGAVTEGNATGDLGRKVLDLEFGYLARSIVPCKQARPRRLSSATQGRYHAGTVITTRLIVRDPP